MWISRWSLDLGQVLWPSQDTETRSSWMGWEFHVYPVKTNPEQKTWIDLHIQTLWEANKSKLTPRQLLSLFSHCAVLPLRELLHVQGLVLPTLYFTQFEQSNVPFSCQSSAFQVLIPHSTQNFEKFILVFNSSLVTHSEMWFHFYLWYKKKYKFSLHAHFLAQSFQNTWHFMNGRGAKRTSFVIDN